MRRNRPPNHRQTTVACRLSAIVALLVGLCVSLPHAALAQTASPELVLYVRRNVGYGGGSQIQGSFRMEVEGPADLAAVTFKIDQVVVETDREPPFRIDFQTDDYGLGWHDLTAEGQTTDGRALVSAPRRFEFVDASIGGQAALRIVLPLFGVVLGVMAVVFVLSMLPTWTGRRRSVPLGAPREYGLLGGTICPRCGRPFPLHLWSLNISFVGKFDRCDHCGKWSLVRRASPEALRAAEAAELKLAGPAAPAPAAGDSLRKEIDDSRYVD